MRPITAHTTRTAPIPRPMTQPNVADSGKGSITTSHGQRIRTSFWALPCRRGSATRGANPSGAPGLTSPTTSGATTGTSPDRAAGTAGETNSGQSEAQARLEALDRKSSEIDRKVMRSICTNAARTSSMPGASSAARCAAPPSRAARRMLETCRAGRGFCEN
jgi:hypothetical protein